MTSISDSVDRRIRVLRVAAVAHFCWVLLGTVSLLWVRLANAMGGLRVSEILGLVAALVVLPVAYVWLGAAAGSVRSRVALAGLGLYWSFCAVQVLVVLGPDGVEALGVAVLLIPLVFGGAAALALFTLARTWSAREPVAVD